MHLLMCDHTQFSCPVVMQLRPWHSPSTTPTTPAGRPLPGVPAVHEQGTAEAGGCAHRHHGGPHRGAAAGGARQPNITPTPVPANAVWSVSDCQRGTHVPPAPKSLFVLAKEWASQPAVGASPWGWQGPARLLLLCSALGVLHNNPILTSLYSTSQAPIELCVFAL
jgi:hypothetical protein